MNQNNYAEMMNEYYDAQEKLVQNSATQMLQAIETAKLYANCAYVLHKMASSGFTKKF